jgi:hypothetical protein
LLTRRGQSGTLNFMRRHHCLGGTFRLLGRDELSRALNLLRRHDRSALELWKGAEQSRGLELVRRHDRARDLQLLGLYHGLSEG